MKSTADEERQPLQQPDMSKVLNDIKSKEINPYLVATSKSSQSSHLYGTNKTALVEKKQHSSHNIVRQKTSKQETGGPGAISTATAKPTTKTKVNPDKTKNEKKEKDEPEPNSWPPFTFDGSAALKTRLVLNLRNCQYDLFRIIALEELNWKVIDQFNTVWEPKSHNPNMHAISDQAENRDQETKMENDKEPNDKKSEKSNSSNQEKEDSTGETAAKSGDDLNEKGNAQKRGSQEELIPRLTPYYDLKREPKVPIQVNPNWNPNNWEVFWCDSGMTPDFLSSLAWWQKANHYLGMYNICRKSTLAMHLKRFQKEFPDHFEFFPKTWMYPAEFHDIQEYSKQKNDKRKEWIEDGRITEAESEKDPPVLYICKPESGSQGKGIFIMSKIEELRVQLNKNAENNRKNMDQYLKVEQSIETAQQNSFPTTQEAKDKLYNRQIEKNQVQYVVQKYVRKPALYQGHKYDFRIYVLITSAVSPMQLFLYDDGLVRLASEKYDRSQNYEDHFVHLTNYSLNKDNAQFDESKHKLRLKEVLRGELTSTGTNGRTYRRHAKQIWQEIEQMVVKTIFTIQPQLAHLYRTSQAKEPDLCFDLLGFDVMLDHKLKPWMLEVNHMPSFRADTECDYIVKKNMIKSALQILQLSLEQRKQMEDILKKEKSQMQFGHMKRMTAAEHCQRVKFDYNLIDAHIPSCGFKRIYPLDPGTSNVAANGEDLDEVYNKLEKAAQVVWKKQVGVVAKKEPNITPHEKKKKRGKNKRHLLTSMTYHIKEKNVDDEQEELPEDGLPENGYDNLEEIKESMAEEKQYGDGNETSKLEDRLRESIQDVERKGDDIRHLMNQDEYESNSNRMIKTDSKQNIGLSNFETGKHSNHTIRGAGYQQISQTPSQHHQQMYNQQLLMNQFDMQEVPQFSNLNMQPNFPQQNFPPGTTFNNFPNQQELNFQVRGQAQKLNQVRPNKTNQTFYQQQVPPGQGQQAHIKLQAPNVPTLNEILAQLHQDPGFRQRYKEYCRAVLDGRFMGNIKNPIHPMFEQNKKAGSQQNQGEAGPPPKNGFFDQHGIKIREGNMENKHVHPYMLSKTYQAMSMQQQQNQAPPGGKLPQTLMINHNQLSYIENNKIPHSVTLLSNNNRQHQMKQAFGGQKYGSVNQHGTGGNTNNASSKVTIPVTSNKQHSHQQRRQQMPQKMDTISHAPMASNPTISEAAYFIQRVNRILQTQGHNNENGHPNEKRGGHHNHYANNHGPHQSSTVSGIDKQAIQQSQIYTSTSQMKQYKLSQPHNTNPNQKAQQNTNPYMIVGSSENGQAQCAIRSLSYNNNGVLEVGADAAVIMKLNGGSMTGTGGKREREIINRHEHRYGGSATHTGLLLPRAQKNNIKTTYLQEALKMKEQRTLQIQQKSQGNLVQFMPVQYPVSPGIANGGEGLNSINEYQPMGNQQSNLIKQQQKQMIDSLKTNFTNKQTNLNKQFTERNTMNVTQNIPNQDSFNKNKMAPAQNQNANYGVTVYSRSQMAQKIEQGASNSQSLINKHQPKRPSNQFQKLNDYNGQELSQLTPNTKGSFVVKNK